MAHLLFPTIDPLKRLRLYWWLWLSFYAGTALSLYSLLINQAILTISPQRWLAQALLVMATGLWLVYANLTLNHRRGETELLATLGAGTVLTLLRGLVYGVMAGFLFTPRPGGWLDWLPALLYSFACIADLFDGYLARITNHATVLGEVLDMEFDGIGMLIALMLAIQHGQLPLVFVLLGLGRPLFVLGLRLRQRWGLPEYAMTPSVHRRVVAGTLMGFVMILLFPVFEPPATHIASIVFGLPVVLSFLRDWFVVTGWIVPTHPWYRWLHKTLSALVFVWLPPGLRMVAAGLAAWLLWQVLSDPVRWQQGFSWAAPASNLLLGLVVTIGGVAVLAVLSGTAGRLGAMGLVLIACVDFLTGEITRHNGLLLAIASFLVIVGSGRLALWRPEERLFTTRLGGKRNKEGLGPGN